MIKLNDITKVYKTRFGPRKVLDSINLTINPGQKLGIVGSNGAGKSTIVRIISGAEKPSSGIIQRGMSVSWPLAFTGGFQGSLTGADNLRCICRIYNVDYATALSYVVSFAELGSYLNEPVKTYSSGMCARLAFAVSMAVDFDCFLIDEIIAVGDTRFQKKCNHELFQARADKAIIMVSHDTLTMQSICDTVVVLSEGKLSHFQSVDDAFRYYNELMASPPATVK